MSASKLRMLLFACLVLSGCGPSTLVKDRIGYEPYSRDELTQSKESITIQQHELKEVPVEFTAQAQGCDAGTGKMYIDTEGNPVMQKASILPQDAWLEKVSITNQTGHIVRLNSAAIALFDPADNQYDNLATDEIASRLRLERPCPSTEKLVAQLMTMKFIGRNTELLPNRTTTGYLVFAPRDMKIPGTWKVSLYEIPVETDAAGRAVRTVQLDFRTVCKKYRETFRRENAFATPVLLSSETIE